MNGELKIINSNKKNDKLCYNGYMYIIHHKLKSCLRWRCTKYGSLNCRAVLKTDIDYKNPKVVVEHIHAMDSKEVNMTICVAEMKVSYA